MLDLFDFFFFFFFYFLFFNNNGSGGGLFCYFFFFNFGHYFPFYLYLLFRLYLLYWSLLAEIRVKRCGVHVPRTADFLATHFASTYQLAEIVRGVAMLARKLARRDKSLARYLELIHVPKYIPSRELFV